MAAFAPQPVTVGSPAKASASDRPIFFAASSEVVSSSPCFDWQPGPTGPNGEARFSSRPSGCRGFLVPLQDFCITADLAAVNAANVLTTRLIDAC